MGLILAMDEKKRGLTCSPPWKQNVHENFAINICPAFCTLEAPLKKNTSMKKDCGSNLITSSENKLAIYDASFFQHPACALYSLG
jgi:hypothetical protein